MTEVLSQYLLYCTIDQLLALRNALYDARSIPEIAEILNQINGYIPCTTEIMDQIRADLEDEDE